MNKFHRWEDFLGSSIDGWQYHFLGELFSNRQEKNKPELPLLAVTGSSGVIDRDKLERRDTSNADKSKYLRVATGDIVYNTMRMWQGVSGSAHKDGIVSPAYTVATTTNLLDKKFAKYLVKNELLIQKFHQNSQGLVNDTLNLKFPNFASIHVQVPPLPEQKKIASILTSVDEVIENTQKQIDKLQDLKKATMNELLTKGIGHTEFKDSELGRIPKSWEVKSLEDMCLKIQDGTHFSPTLGGDDFKYITSKNIRMGEINLDDVETISRNEHEKIYKRCDVKVNDLLLTKDGANTGNIAMNTLDEEFSLLSSVAFLRPSKRVDGEYLLQFMMSEKAQNLIAELMSGNAITRLTLTKIKEFKVIVPSREEQGQVASILSSIDRHIKHLKNKSLKTQSLKKSLMQDLLTGKIRVKAN